MSDYSQTRSFNLGIADDTSIGAAMIYDDLVYAQKIFGKGFFFRSYEQMINRFPMFSEQTIRRHVKLLSDGGWISTKVMKVNGKPTCHYQIGRFLSANLVETMETTKLADSIYIETKETTKDNTLLSKIISLVNPKEKETTHRQRALNARLKDYTEEEVVQAAIAFSKSEWHRSNKQMSIDNLLAPSKFGRWYTQSKQGDTPNEDAYGYRNGKKIITTEDNGNQYWGGERITPQNQDQVLKERMEQ